jgi:hypothetical protein
MNKRALMGLLALAVLVLGACTQARVNDSEIGVRYGHGPIEGDHFEKVVEPGGMEWVANDEVYKLPARQITWTTGAGGDADALQFKVGGGEQMVMELSTRFYLNSTLDENDEPFKTFFNSVCRKYDCWDGAIGGTSPEDGWYQMLADIVGNPQRAAATRVGKGFDADKLRYDNKVADQFADQFADEFERLLADEVGVGEIFCGPGYVRGENDCPPVAVNVTSVVFADGAREGIRERQRLAEEQEDLAVQEEETARAQQRVNEARATAEYEVLKRSEAMLECAKNPECQLTIIVGSDDDVSVPAT